MGPSLEGPPALDEAPLRAELFSIGQLQRHALTLAGWHELSSDAEPDRLLPRLSENERVLTDAYALLVAAVTRGRQITPAAEWFVDNYHLIEEQIRLARRHLPRGYLKELPRIVDGAPGTPRVYALALELISHAHGRVDLAALRAFIESYQSVQPLQLGELWAIPIMLRLALIENLRRVVALVTAGRLDRERARTRANRLLEVGANDPSRVVLVLAEMIEDDPTLSHAFVAELASRIQGQGAAMVFPLAWLEQRLIDRGLTLERVFQLASQSQAADQVTVGNSIGSLRFLGATDWRHFVERASVVEQALRQDALYGEMDFATRDGYRHVVETIAREGPLSELAVARAAVSLTAEDPAGRAGHVGYFLADEGRDRLEAEAGAVGPARRVARALRRARLPIYLGSIASISVAITIPLALQASTSLGAAGLALWVALVLLAASELAVSITHWAATWLAQPTLLPRLDFSEGIPSAHRTLVAVPTMLTSLESIDEIVAALEVRFLANRDPNLGLALVTDFRDAETETLESDAALLEHTCRAVEALRAKYASEPGGGLFLLHRARRWNPGEGVWMGWERKRGKLEDLNATLRGEEDRFARIVGPLAELQTMKYVIVLDTDTDLPRDAARALAATLGHPLNRPVFDPVKGRVTKGYAILQPRVGVTLASSNASRFARLSVGDAGIDPYTRAVSNVYQDLFGEGSFVGKGIYDVDGVRQAITGRFPNDRILSHDLLEGAYARSALVSDILLFEDFPSSYLVDASRRARWIRGDWQIARWLFGCVPSLEGRAANPISMLSRWKILDNLRRSVVPASLVALLAFAWTIPGIGWIAFSLVMATLVIPNFLAALAALTRRPADVARSEHVEDIVSASLSTLASDILRLAWLPHDALLGAMAIGRAAVRVLITRRHLLEWRTAADAQRAKAHTLAATYLALWVIPASALAATLALLVHPEGFPYADTAANPQALAAPVIVLWTIAPALVWWVSRPIAPRASPLSTVDTQFLRGVARRTWRFFDTYVGPEDNHLPPDNVQEYANVGVAHRTSPTNIGMALLANLAAYDFGHVLADEVVDRTTKTFATMERLERFRGHFYNWYDTRTLEPLRPLYVSSVDSGNLAGHLLTLAAGLEEMAADSLLRHELLEGLDDTLTLIVEAAASEGKPLDVDAARALLSTRPETHAQWRRLLEELEPMTAALEASTQGEPDTELATWTRALDAQCKRMRFALETDTRDDDEAPATLDSLGYTGRLRALAVQSRALAEQHYDFLYDPSRRLLAIGYNVAEHRLDASFYDLLASEARLASFVAIALGKLPQEHWFSLGRLLTTSGGRPTLLSWSGSMFEYLMPLLVMPAYQGTLLDATYRAVVARQIDYGREHDVPWGVSESGFSETDAHLNYQYRAFGVPGLGFKRGLANDLVITPYACALGLMVDPEAACANLRRLAAEERLGGYGFYEAIDYTASRMPPDQTSVTVRSYMAHHQGMTFLALAYQLLGKPMQRRFEADASLRATVLLLQERVPKAPPIHPHPAELSPPRPVATSQDHGVRVIATPAAAFPQVHLLSNGEYHVAVTNAGGGYSRWRDLAVTRWVEDPTRDCWGSFVYVRDLATGSFWSVTHQPTLRDAASYEAIFSQGRAEFRRRDGDLTTHVEISVSPEDDIELRRITLSNLGNGARTIELTSFAEVVLTQAAADASHRTFSNLFVQTEILRTHRAILCTRRPRSGGETPPWMFHLMTVHGESKGETSYETDRASFIGRARTAADPAAMYRLRLNDREGAVLDPIVSIRSVVQIEPDETMQVHVVTGVAETREGAIALIEKYVDRHVAGRVLELAWTQSHVVQRRLGATSADTLLYERLAANVLYMNPALRAPSSVLVKNRLGQSGLWPYGISGDLPIVLVRIAEGAHLEVVRQMVSAHAYWRAKGLIVDLVVWNDDPSGYRQDVQEEILRVIAGSADAALIDRPGGIFVRRGDHMSEEDSVLIQSIARLIVKGGAGTLAEQIERRPHAGGSVEEFVPGSGEGPWVRGERRRQHTAIHSAFPSERRRAQEKHASPSAVTARADLVSWNGHGGFTRDGREYVIVTTREERTPLPWVNVMANPYFGTVVSESGGAYTWCENAHSYRLTPWGNDPVSDVSGEAMYVRDEDDGRFWSPTPLPCGGVAPYTTRHGFGYTAFETDQAGIASELRTFVATDAPVKFLMLELRNTSGRRRRLSLTATFDLVLGSQRPQSLPHVVTDVDPRTGALFAHNAYAAEFAPRVAFLDSSETVRTVTGDRHELLGQNGDPARPAFMQHARLSGRMGTGLDPCFAMQVSVDLADGQTREVAFMFGSGRDGDDARHLVERFHGVGGAQRALDQVWASWKRTLSAVRVETPDPGLDHLANGWLVYQVLACRMWGRSGFYQSGGAFGFRDQLQDAMALLHAEPAVLREQLLRAAAHQFPQGDVQHWWHPPLGRGVRTRISDDYLWLPYAVCRYITGRGDTGVLDEPIEFIEGRAVEPGEDSYYDLPTSTIESATLYAHCVRAIQHGLRFGEHGLPLMGSGDWNDGMNLVGDEGRGESVWLAFFLHDVLVQFGALGRARGDDSFADECDRNASTLAANIEAHGWDGAWYRRAYFDDGSPLGSESSPECQIDSLPQSWAMLTGVGGAERARAGLAAVDARLVDRELGVIKLFDPPFDHSALEPGYVKGYVPGVRENGGQYTHAAVWTTMAFAAGGQIDKAWELFDLINPTRHGKDAASIATYKVEPYVVAADVYTNPQHAGRGGWTWYTGSAGWMYRLILESLLGLRLEIDRLHVAPRLPAAWEGFTVHYRHGDTMHHIEVKRTGPGDAVTRVTCDGVLREDRSVQLRDDREEHWAIVEVGG